MVNIEYTFVVFEVTDPTILSVFRSVRKIVKSDYYSSTAEMFAWTHFNGTLYVHCLCCCKYCISDCPLTDRQDSDPYVAPSSILAMDHRFDHLKKEIFDGNICASVKNLPLHIVVRSIPMNFGGGINMARLFCIREYILCYK